MNFRFILMVLGTLLCLSPLFLAPRYLTQLPMLLDLQFASFSAFFGWALVLAITLLPVVSIFSIVRGWHAWIYGPREAAHSRLLLWPFLWFLICAALFSLGRLFT